MLDDPTAGESPLQDRDGSAVDILTINHVHIDKWSL